MPGKIQERAEIYSTGLSRSVDRLPQIARTSPAVGRVKEWRAGDCLRYTEINREIVVLKKMKKLVCVLPLLMVTGMGCAQAADSYNYVPEGYLNWDCGATTFTQNYWPSGYDVYAVYSVPAMTNMGVERVTSVETEYHNGVLVYSMSGGSYDFSCEYGTVSVSYSYASNGRVYWD